MTLSPCPCPVEHWKADLIRSRAVRLGFRGADLQDVQQDVLLAVLGFQFRPERANGATETTALIALIDRRLLMARRCRHRYLQHLERIPQCADAGRSSQGLTEGNYEEQINRRLDVREILSKLEPEDQELCRMLAAGQSIVAIAGQLGCGWHTVKRRIDGLRELFEVMGMDGYLI